MGWNIAANSQTIWEQYKVITLASVRFPNAGRSIRRTLVSRSPNLRASIPPVPKSKAKSPPCHTRSFLISCKPLLNVAAVCRRVKGGIFFFLLNGKCWVSCSDEPALHQVLVILGVCAQLPHCVRSRQETLCGDPLSLGPGPERRKCFFYI